MFTKGSQNALFKSQSKPSYCRVPSGPMFPYFALTIRDFLLVSKPLNIHLWLSSHQAGHQPICTLQKLMVGLSASKWWPIWQKRKRSRIKQQVRAYTLLILKFKWKKCRQLLRTINKQLYLNIIFMSAVKLAVTGVLAGILHCSLVNYQFGGGLVQPIHKLFIIYILPILLPCYFSLCSSWEERQ